MQPDRETIGFIDLMTAINLAALDRLLDAARCRGSYKKRADAAAFICNRLMKAQIQMLLWE